MISHKWLPSGVNSIQEGQMWHPQSSEHVTADTACWEHVPPRASVPRVCPQVAVTTLTSHYVSLCYRSLPHPVSIILVVSFKKLTSWWLAFIIFPNFINCCLYLLFCYGATAPSWPRPPTFYQVLRSHSIGLLWMSDYRRRELGLTTHNIHERQATIPQTGLEPATPASKRPQTHTWDRAATGPGLFVS
jgi:hypothetical protein